jgi:hypothetical protein
MYTLSQFLFPEYKIMKASGAKTCIQIQIKTIYICTPVLLTGSGPTANIE